LRESKALRRKDARSGRTGKNMKVVYHNGMDILTIVFSAGIAHESHEDKPGVILDYDQSGALVSMEVLDASQKGMLPDRIEYQAIFSPVEKGAAL
jgi:uncharacterized protein YuzE